MPKPFVFAAALCIGLAGPLSGAEPKPSGEAIHGAVARALPLIRKGGAGHMAHRTCFACHNQAIPIFALMTARSRGLRVDGKEIQKHLHFIAAFLDGNRANYQKGLGQGGQVETAGYALWALDRGGWKPDATTAAVAEYLLLRDKDRDHWRVTSNRPPSEASDFTATFVAIRGLQAFATAAQKPRCAQRLRTVRGWLAKTPTNDTEDRVFRLWGLTAVVADGSIVRAATRDLIKSQRPDGGWAQVAALQSDAYATGSALVALRRAAGLDAEGPAYQRGVQFLLKTQLQDGTWHVGSRSKPFQTYFESGFPHGKDQFISLSASSWAAAALALALPPAKDSLRSPKAR
jgi:hypothetical protein